MKLLDEIRDDEKIKEIAREVARASRDTLLLLKEQYNIPMKSTLDFIESWIKEAGYPYIHDISGVDQKYPSFCHTSGHRIEVVPIFVRDSSKFV